MKKSQLRNIIKESIKEVISEQPKQINSHKSIEINICSCDDQPPYSGDCSNISTYFLPVGSQTYSPQWGYGLKCNGNMCTIADTQTGNNEFELILPDWNGLVGLPNGEFIKFKLLQISTPIQASIIYNLNSSTISDCAEIECHKCKNGAPVSNMFPDPPGCPPGWDTMPPFNPNDCKPDVPTGDPEIKCECCKVYDYGMSPVTINQNYPIGFDCTTLNDPTIGLFGCEVSPISGGPGAIDCIQTKYQERLQKLANIKK